MLEPKSSDQSSKAQQAPVVEKESGERLAPIVQYATSSRFRVAVSPVHLTQRKSDAINGSANQSLHIINDQRSVHRNRQGFLALVELPAAQARGSMPGVDVAMLE
jgi:hypothetical protein